MRKLCTGWVLLMALPAFGSPGVSDGNPKKQAWDYVQYYEFEKAIPIFRTLRAQEQPGGPKWIEATFGLAMALHYKTPPDASSVAEARRLYLELADRCPDAPCAPRALLNAARVDELRDYYRDVINLESARKLYRRVIARYPKSPLVGEAVLRLAQSYTITMNPREIEEGIKIARNWLKDHSTDPLAGLMYLMMGDIYFEPLEKYDEAVKAYIKADELKSLDPGQEGYTYWRIARLAHKKLNDRATAVKYYTKIITDTPTFSKGYQSQMALKELGAPVPPLLAYSTTQPVKGPAEVKK
jgi:tetratricopeptide (TPR) repeat protein